MELSKGRRIGVRAGRALAAAAVVGLLTAGCTIKSGPDKRSVKPAFKRYVVEHPIAAGPRTLRSGSAALRVEAVVVEEHRTVLGPESWLAVAHVVVKNDGGGPLLLQDLVDAFRFHGRSGTVRSGVVFPEGRGGWQHQHRTGQPTHLPPGGEGRLRVQAEIGAKESRDDPVALTFREHRLDLL